MSKELPQIRVDDLWTMLLSTIRYSMGRMSYMPSTCIMLCKDYGQHLQKWHKEQIVNEIRKEVTRYESIDKTLGMECDHQTWKSGYQELAKLWDIELEDKNV